MKNLLEKSKEFFKKNSERIAINNWKLMKPMSIFYLLTLIFYLFVQIIVNKTLDIERPLNLIILVVATAFHSAFTAIIWLVKKPPVKYSICATVLALFGVTILILTLLLNTVCNPNSLANLFPLMIILMGQIYILTPKQNTITFILAGVVFIIVDYIVNKPITIFIWDIVAIIIAECIAFVSYISSLYHLIQNNELRNDLEHMCSIDLMTGLLNKTTFEYRATEFIRKAKNYDYSLSIIDLDNFKGINDKYGHQIGDEIIIKFAKLFGSCFDNDNYFTGRYGGDEFILFTKTVNKEELINKLNELQNEFNKYSLEKFEFKASFSVGVSIAETTESTFFNLFLLADKLLYRGKKDNNNWLHISNKEFEENDKDIMLIVDDDVISRRILKKYFNESFLILEANNGQEALTFVERYGNGISIILLDLKMPIIDGQTMLENLKKATISYEMPIIIISAYEIDISEFQKLNIHGHIKKPFNAADVMNTVKKALH